jgi:hypothetical protein
MSFTAVAFFLFHSLPVKKGKQFEAKIGAVPAQC